MNVMVTAVHETRRRAVALPSELRRRPALVAALIYLALALLLFAPALLPGHVLSGSDMSWFSPPWLAVKPPGLTHAANPDLADARSQIQPLTQYAAERLPHIALWDPYIQGGRPLLADAQSAVFSPFNLPAYVLPFLASLAWTAVMKVWVAAFGMFLLGRALG